MDSENQSSVDFSSARYAVDLALKDAQSAQASLANAIQSLQSLSDMLDDENGLLKDVTQIQRVVDMEMERVASLLKTSTNAAAFAKPHLTSLWMSQAVRKTFGER